MIKSSYDVAVIGGGPAGMAAAVTAANRQANVLLIDAGQSPGGNYYKPLPPSFHVKPEKHDAKIARALQENLAKLSQQRVDTLTKTQVWGIFHGTETTFNRQQADASTPFTLYLDPAGSVEAQILIIATGVYDRPIPFPGWTLPGVMTPGAAQILLKKQGLLPGKRAIVAGSGPLQLVVAATLASAGADVVALLDPSAASTGLTRIPGSLWGQWEKIGEFARHVRTLVRKRVPIRFRHAIFKANGSPQAGVQEVLIGRVDADGYPLHGTEESLAVDLVCAAYGFMPSIALTSHLGCNHVFNTKLGAYVPTHNAQMQTSQDGVLVAGDITGVGGKSLAELQGKIAGISALEKLGALENEEAEKWRAGFQTAVAREKRFADWLWDRWQIKPGFWGMIEEDTIICRCEAVTAAALRQSYASGVKNIFGLKMRTRLGMGICQGRYCATNAALLMAHELDSSVAEIGLPSIRPPIVPVRLSTIADSENK